GYCATHGICGRRADGDPLSCPSNTPAQPLNATALQKLQAVCPQLAAEVGGTDYCCTEEQLDQLQAQIQVASIFLVGCPACNHNFKHFFCLLTCSPDQATFANVTAVQPAADTGATAIAEADYFVAASFGARFFASCKDVVYPVMNQRAMNFVGGGARNFQEWFDFIGLVKDKRFPPTGAPYQMDFPPGEQAPENMTALDGFIPSCGEGALACSCGDCPSAPGCEPPPQPPPPEPAGCPALGTSWLTCRDLSLAALYLGLLACLPLVVRLSKDQLAQSREWRRSQAAMAAAAPGGAAAGNGSEPLLGGAGGSSAEIEEDGGGGREEEEPEELIQWPAAEQLLRRWFYRLGRCCARRPALVLAASLLLVGACALGLTRLRVMTDPQELWVGPGSQAAQEKAAYEAAFGPFYRITQLILSTTPAANSSTATPSGLPAIVTDEHIRLLFDMQDEIDALSASYDAPGSAGDGGGGGSWNVTLADVCLAPLGSACATQSVLQYWGMSRDVFEHGETFLQAALCMQSCPAKVRHCCRSALGGPTDPHLVLGGFPTDAATFRNYTADATAFVVTFPIDSHAANRGAALAWEAAFVELASGLLSEMAEGVGLRLSFSTERSVQDELARESGSDAPTVLLSYLVMLLYIAVALGRFPRGADWRDVLSPPCLLPCLPCRAALGLGGVLIVAASVVGSLGLCSWAGMSATLIIMEVIPFLVLAVGVDNMFILAAALQRQPETHPLPHRLGLALAAVGPSITLAGQWAGRAGGLGFASCEVVAFALGGLTSMPALRNFSICASLAVLLDYLLQVTAFVALLALDARRLEQGRYDCMPWVRWGRGGQALWSWRYDTRYVGVSSALRSYMRRVHAPLLARPAVKAAVLALFGGMFLLSCALLPRLERGLDQSVALPRDSYLQRYYADVVGPPVMFVVQGLNVSEGAPDVGRVCSVAGCDPDSLLNQASRRSQPAKQPTCPACQSSWLDDFLTWASPEIPQASSGRACLRLLTVLQCCRQDANGTRCPPPDQPPCSDSPDACADCTACFAPSDLPGGRPDLQQFQDKLPWFLDSLPSAACAKGGAGAYTDAIQARRRHLHPYACRRSSSIGSKPAYAVRAFTASASERLGLRLLPYSVFHIFFEQYLTIGGEALTLLGSACVAIFLICLAATGSPWSATLIVLTLCMLLVDVMGFMVLAGIQLNAVSLVNLVMSLGIGVEFCAHLVHAF
ncbi:hypothetical protein CHLNCDRAFT_6284, partial [Chlorella variabilis]